jgi:hypothetical protein
MAATIKVGLVPSLGKPGGNVTGVTLFISEVVAKRLRWLLELVPRVGLLRCMSPILTDTVEKVGRGWAARGLLRESELRIHISS